MKIKNTLWYLCLMALVGLTVSSCSSDDDESGDGIGGGSGANTCYLEVDGKRTDYGYAYIYAYEDGGVEINFTTVDLIYYINNPDKITQGLMVSDIWMDFQNLKGSNQVPLGNISSRHNSNMDGDEITFDFETSTYDLYRVYINGNGDEEDYPWYNEDWTGNSSVSTMKVSKSGETYTMECPALHLLCSDDDGGVSFESRKTVGNFYFHGTFTYAPMFAEDDTRAIRVVEVTDSNVWNKLKSMRRHAK